MMISKKPFINADAEETILINKKPFINADTEALIELKKVLTRLNFLKKAARTMRAANLVVNVLLSAHEFPIGYPFTNLRKMYIA